MQRNDLDAYSDDHEAFERATWVYEYRRRARARASASAALSEVEDIRSGPNRRHHQS